MDTQELVSRANARKGDWPDLAKEAGVSYSWLVKFMGGEIPNPGVRTLKKLEAALQSSLPPTGSGGTSAPS